MSSQIGIQGQMLVDGRDISRLLSSFNHSSVQGNVDNTRLRTPGNFRTHANTLNGGSLGFNGDLPDDDAEALKHLEQFLKRDSSPRLYMQAPFGADAGKLVRMGRALRTTAETSVEIEGILSFNGSFETTTDTTGMPSEVPGLGLFSPNLEGSTLNQNEIVNLVFSDADPNQFFAVGAQGTSQGFSFQAGTVTNNDLAAGIQGLAAYAGRTVTVTGPALTGTTTKSGTKRVEFDGAVDVPTLKLLQGELHAFALSGATGTKSPYPGVSIDPTANSGAGTDAATVQAATQAKGGQYAGVIVTKTGTGGSAVYIFAYPIGANPADMVQPTATIPARPSGTNLLTGKTFVNASLVSITDLTDGSATSTARPLDSTNGFYSYSPNADTTITVVRVYVSAVTGNELLLSVSNGYQMASFKLANGNYTGDTNSDLYSVPVGGVGWFTLIMQTAHIFNASAPLVLSVYGYGAGVIREIEAYETGDMTPPFTGPDPQVSVSTVAGGISLSVGIQQIQQGGAFSGLNVITSPTIGPTVLDYEVNTVTSAGMVVSLQSLLPVVGSSTWVIEHAPNNGSGAPGAWATLYTFPVVTQTGAYFDVIEKGKTINPFLRARCLSISGGCQVAIAAGRLF